MTGQETTSAEAEASLSFEALFRQHHPEVLRYAQRRTDAETARDIAAETFVVAWRRLADIPNDHARAWLFATARHLLSNALRSSARRERLSSRLRDLSAEGVSAADLAQRVVDVDYLDRLLSALTDVEREALELVEWDGLSPAEAATAVGCTPAALRVRLFRARRRLMQEHRTCHAAEHRGHAGRKGICSEA